MSETNCLHRSKIRFQQWRTDSSRGQGYRFIVGIQGKRMEPQKSIIHNFFSSSIYNFIQAKEQGLTGQRLDKFDKDRPERPSDFVTVNFQPTGSSGPKFSQSISIDLNATEIKTKMFEVAGT